MNSLLIRWSAVFPGLARVALAAIVLVLFAGGTCFGDETLPLAARWELFRPAAAEQGSAAAQALGQDGLVAVLWLEPGKDYHIYSNEPEKIGLPTTLVVTVEPGGGAPSVYYPPGKPTPEVFDAKVISKIYAEPTPLFVPIKDPAAAKERVETLELRGKVSGLLCSGVNCRPFTIEPKAAWSEADLRALPEATAQLWWPVFLDARGVAAPGPKAPSPVLGPAAAAAGDGAAPVLKPRYFQPGLEIEGPGKAMVFGFLAGLILNFMPCVLPVVSLKLSALVAASGIHEKKRQVEVFRVHNIFFSLGVLLYFLFLAILLSAAGLAWGQLFQKPKVVLLLAALVFPLGLSLFGLFDLPVVDLKTGTDTAKKPRTQALFTGFLATLLATPCSGPFLGGVLGWVLLHQPLVIIGIFLSIGLGMASPYLLLAARPGLVRFFPRPGAWTMHLEKIVGFFLMATCIYLLNMLPAPYLLPGMVLLWTTAFAAWMWGHWTNLSHSALRRWGVRTLAVLLVAGVAAFVLRPVEENAVWETYGEKTFLQALGKERMLVDFTADWCPNCKVLEKTTLAPKYLAEWQKRYALRLVQVDLTRENPSAQALLRRLGSQSIPIVALFPTGRDSSAPLVLRDLFTPSQMDKALEAAFGEKTPKPAVNP